MYDIEPPWGEKLDGEIDHMYTDNIVCPYCGEKNGDYCEFESDNDDLGYMVCGECEKTFSAERIITLQYSTYVIDWLVEWKLMNHKTVQRIEANEKYLKWKLTVSSGSLSSILK